MTFLVGGAIALPLCLKWRKKTLAAPRIVVSEVHAIEYSATTELEQLLSQFVFSLRLIEI